MKQSKASPLISLCLNPASFILNQLLLLTHIPFRNLVPPFSFLKLLFDWDFTMTHFFLDGRRACSCHKAIEDCDLLPASYHE